MALYRPSLMSSKRPGVVLLGVLVVVVILAVIAYQYSDRMVAEYQSAVNVHRVAQARAFADAGVHQTAALLANPDNIINLLNGNPYDNPDKLKNVFVPDADNRGNAGRFTLVAPLDPDDPSNSGNYRAGVTDEAGKININAFVKRDPTGQGLYDVLVKLPNMTEEIAAAITDWVDSDTTPREGGAEDDYYSGLTPSYRCKNGPLDSLEELLLVKGVTRELLYGSDLNRNGLVDGNEGSANGSVERGWAAFLTVSSRESNRDGTGQQLVYLNDTNLSDVYEKLAPVIGNDLAKYYILYRQYGPSNSSGGQQSLGRSILSLFTPSSSSSKSGATVKVGNLSEYVPKLTKVPIQKISSLFDLVGSQVSIADKDPRKPATVYTTPLNDPTHLKTLLPLLYQIGTLTEDAEIPARVNVNTAPREVLAALPSLTEADVQTILSLRPKMSSQEAPSDIFLTPAWLASEAILKLDTLKKLEPIVTTKTQVYHMQIVGSFDNQQGPTSRVEAIVDSNFGRPRIVFYRDWTELGKTRLP